MRFRALAAMDPQRARQSVSRRLDAWLVEVVGVEPDPGRSTTG